MQASRVKLWSKVHSWTSLVCTLFLLMLCLTGLPLIFYHEIDHLTGNAPEPPTLPASTPHADLDRVVEATKRQRPNDVVRYAVWDRDEPEIVSMVTGKRYDGPQHENRLVVVDARTADVLGEPEIHDGVMPFLLKLHTDMFAGLPGKLFLGFMGVVFAASIVSGVVVYGPFMRRLDFGAVRRARGRRLKWLDLHNLIGVVTLTWALVVGLTGTVNALADLVVRAWRADQLAAMVTPYKGLPAPARFGSVSAAVAAARAAAPGMEPAFVAWPGTEFSSGHHYGVFMRGDTPLTARLLKPVLVDAQTGAVTAARELPWYVTALLVSQPLHFGNYGGLPLKIVWALLDLATIVVLGSGVYLWVARRRWSARPLTVATSP